MSENQIALHRRLTSKFLAIALLTSLAPLLFFYFYATGVASQMLVDSLRNDLKEKSFLVGADIDRYFRQREHDVRVLSQADVLESGGIDQIIKYLTEVIHETPYLDDIDVIDSQGLVIASSGEQNEQGMHILSLHPQLESLIERVRNARQGQLFVSEILQLDGGPGLAFLTPITDESNTIVIKTLLVEINLDTVRQIVADFDDRVIGEKFVYLVDNEGRVIVTADPGVSLLAPFPDLEVQPGLLQNFSQQGDVGSVIYRDSAGELVMAGYADMAEFGINQAMDWSIISVAPIRDITAPVAQMRTSLMIFVVVAFSFAGFFMIVTSRSILGSVKTLVKGARRVGRGEFGHRIEPVADDEFGYLATVINQTLDQLANAQAQLLQSAELASLGEISAGLAHELNQPLSILRLRLDMARQMIEDGNEVSSDQQLKDIGAMVSQIDRATKIISHLKVFSRQGEPGTYEATDINWLLDESLTLIRDSLRIAGIDVTKDDAQGLPKVPCNFIGIEQVLTNLISNSRNALEGRERKQIVLRSYRRNEFICIDVVDTGWGISEEDLPKVFDPFFTTNSVGHGTGLGMSISHGIIQEHEGTLRATSTPGRGTTFTVSLPLGRSR